MKTLDQLRIKIDSERIAQFCRERGIRKMSVFGSAVRDDFDPERSDVDVLTDFEPGALDGVGLDYFGYGDELAEIIGRRVDFCSKLNRHILPRVEKQMITIYE